MRVDKDIAQCSTRSQEASRYLNSYKAGATYSEIGTKIPRPMSTNLCANFLCVLIITSGRPVRAFTVYLNKDERLLYGTSANTIRRPAHKNALRGLSPMTRSQSVPCPIWALSPYPSRCTHEHYLSEKPCGPCPTTLISAYSSSGNYLLSPD